MTQHNIKTYCQYCNKELIGHQRLIRKFCNRQCYLNSLSKKTIKCLHCGKSTNNPKFCSSSCSASYTNKQQHKKQLSKQCLKCNSLIVSNRKYCKNCYVTGRFRPNIDISLEKAIN